MNANHETVMTVPDLATYIQLETAEAMGPTNRYYWSQFSGRHGDTATPDELMLFYIEHNGAEDFGRRHTIR